MKKTAFNKLTASLALTMTAALCLPTFAGADTTVGNVRNSLSDKELAQLNREENKARKWFEENYHVKTESSVGSVRNNLSDSERAQLNREENKAKNGFANNDHVKTESFVGSVRNNMTDVELAKLEREENKSRA